jgi:hypothetical protein
MMHHQPNSCFALTTNLRHIPQTQERILDAPDLVDDYYLNLLDWSCNNTVREDRQKQLTHQHC